MGKILIVYGTSYGQTERIAHRIGERLTSAGHEVCIYKGDSLPPGLTLGEYTGCVIAASVIRGQHQPYIRDFVRRYAPQLEAVSCAFVSVSGSAQQSPEEARRYLRDFLQETGWNPRFTASFAGAIAYTQYGRLLRWMMKLISQRRGAPTDTTRDHEMTDWVAVDRFAGQIADVVAAAPKGDRAEGLLGQPVYGSR